MFQADSMRPNKNQRVVKSVFKTHIEVFHFMQFDNTRIARQNNIDEDSEEFSNTQKDRYVDRYRNCK